MRKIGGVLYNVNDEDLERLKNNPEKFWEGVEEIYRGAFDNPALTSIIIPNSVKLIDKWAFGNGGNLKSISLSKDIIIYVISYDKRELMEMVDSKDIEIISSNKLSFCSAVKYNIEPKSARAIKKFLFQNCPDELQIDLREKTINSREEPKSIEELFNDLASGKIDEEELRAGLKKIVNEEREKEGASEEAAKALQSKIAEQAKRFNKALEKKVEKAYDKVNSYIDNLELGGK